MTQRLAPPTAAFAALAALAACHSQPSVDLRNAKPSEVASQAAAAGVNGTTFRPGKWATTVTIADMQMPGMPPHLAEQMKARMAQGMHTTESCLTPEQAKQPDSKFFSGMDQACKYDHFTLAGGTLDAAMTCGAGKMARKMTMHGTFTPESSDIDSTVSGGEGPMGAMSMHMHIAAKRIGECAKS